MSQPASAAGPGGSPAPRLVDLSDTGILPGGRATARTIRARAEADSDAVIQHLLAAARTMLGMEVAFVTRCHGAVEKLVHLNGESAGPGWAVGMTIANDDTPPWLPSPHRTTGPATKATTTVSVPLTLPDGSRYGALGAATWVARPGPTETDPSMLGFLARLMAEEISKLDTRTLAGISRRQTIAGYLEPGAIDMHLQPIVDLKTGQLLGVEALSRFPDHHGSPEDVFDVAHHAGLGTALELAAIRTALTVLDSLPPAVYLSINAGPDTVVAPAFHTLLGQVACERVVLELTEHIAFTDQARLKQSLAELKQRGLRVAVDDTGSGFASLQNILALAPEVIKLDRALATGIDQDPVRQALVRALNGFATDCGASMVVEGIETRAELETLRALGVRAGQGFHLGMPVRLQDLDLDPDTDRLTCAAHDRSYQALLRGAVTAYVRIAGQQEDAAIETLERSGYIACRDHGDPQCPPGQIDLYVERHYGMTNPTPAIQDLHHARITELLMAAGIDHEDRGGGVVHGLPIPAQQLHQVISCNDARPNGFTIRGFNTDDIDRKLARVAETLDIPRERLTSLPIT